MKTFSLISCNWILLPSGQTGHQGQSRAELSRTEQNGKAKHQLNCFFRFILFNVVLSCFVPQSWKDSAGMETLFCLRFSKFLIFSFRWSSQTEYPPFVYSVASTRNSHITHGTRFSSPLNDWSSSLAHVNCGTAKSRLEAQQHLLLIGWRSCLY